MTEVAIRRAGGCRALAPFACEGPAVRCRGRCGPRLLLLLQPLAPAPERSFQSHLHPEESFRQIQWLERAGFKARCFQTEPRGQKKLIKAGNGEKCAEQPIPSRFPGVASGSESLVWINTRVGWAKVASQPGRGCERAGATPGASPPLTCQGSQPPMTYPERIYTIHTYLLRGTLPAQGVIVFAAC